MSRRQPPFAAFEWLIAWRYLKSKRSEGGVSVMTLISLFGIAVAVFALVATLAVRSGFRTEFVKTILGANPHTILYSEARSGEFGQATNTIPGYQEIVDQLRAVEGVVRVAPQVRAQLLAASDIKNTGIELYGLSRDDVSSLPLIGDPVSHRGSLENLAEGIAIGVGAARKLGVSVGDRIRLISPNGSKTAFGISPRINTYHVIYIFEVGRYDIDNTRAYLEFGEAQKFLNREGVADEIAVFVEDPERIEISERSLLSAIDFTLLSWSWKDSSGSLLRALQMEDNLMFIVMSILVLIATSNIVSGLVMLVKNKSASIGILRSIGFSQGSILRLFFLYGAIIGITGTVIGVILGCLFAIYIDPIFSFVNYLAGGDAWDPQVRFLASLPARLELSDVLSAVALSLGLSFVVTLIPARRAARMYPGEAIRNE